MIILRLLCVAALLLCGACKEFTDVFFDSGPSPSGLTATTGRSDEMELSWSEPDTEKDDTVVVSYDIERDGSFAGSTASSSWTDPTADPATEYTYTVSANFSDGSTSSESGSATGWYVPAKNLVLGTGPGHLSTPGSNLTVDGWFETIVVKGWIYHFDTDSATELSICDHDAPWDQLSLGTASSFTWTADRTGSVWMKTAPARGVEAWYE